MRRRGLFRLAPERLVDTGKKLKKIQKVLALFRSWLQNTCHQPEFRHGSLPMNTMTPRSFRSALLVALLACGESAVGQMAVETSDVKGGQYAYEFQPAQADSEAAAHSWNDAFGGASVNAKAVGERNQEYEVLSVTNCQDTGAGMEVVMEFDFSSCGHLATEVTGGHWMQKFLKQDVQAYYRRSYSINGGREILIEESPAWGQFPNSGDDRETGFLRMAYMGGDHDDPLVFTEPAKTFTYRIVVKTQDRKSGDEAVVPPGMVQPIRASGDPQAKRPPMVLTFTMQPAGANPSKKQ
jgi:hypothetical protein